MSLVFNDKQIFIIELKQIWFLVERNDLDGAVKTVDEAAAMGVAPENMRHKMLRLLEVKLTAVGKEVTFKVPEGQRRERKRGRKNEKAEEGEDSESAAEDSKSNEQKSQTKTMQ